MQPFCFQVYHRKGIDNANANILSRQVELDGQLEPEKEEGCGKIADYRRANYIILT